MALITPGSMVGQISGRLGSVVYSHNKGGPYVRNGTIPVTSTTSHAINAKARLGSISTAWKSLTDAQRQAWVDWSLANPVINRLGRAIHTPGNAAYIRLNARLSAAGLTLIDVPPVTPGPEGLTSLAQSCDIGAGTFVLTYAPTPLAATEYLWIQAAVTNSGAIQNVNNLLRFVGVSSAAEASPFDHQTLVETRLGTLTVGQTVTCFVSVLDSASGQISRPQRVETIVSTT